MNKVGEMLAVASRIERKYAQVMPNQERVKSMIADLDAAYEYIEKVYYDGDVEPSMRSLLHWASKRVGDVQSALHYFLT